MAPLSRDHHLALVIAYELTHAEPRTAKAAAARFVRLLAEHELAHFAREEAVLLPAVPEAEPGPALTRRVLEDHEYLRSAMRRLQSSPELSSVELLRDLGLRLRAHVMMEERELFPYVEQSLDAAALKDLGARLALEPPEQS